MPDQMIQTPNPEEKPVFVPGPWDPAVAAKKVAWGLGKLGLSTSMAPALAPMATQAIQKISAITQPYGLTIVIDQSLFEKALPFLIFAALAVGLDFAKMKTKLPWL